MIWSNNRMKGQNYNLIKAILSRLIEPNLNV